MVNQTYIRSRNWKRNRNNMNRQVNGLGGVKKEIFNAKNSSLQTEVVSQDRDESWRKEAHFVDMDQGTELEGIRRKLFLDRYSMKDDKGEVREKFVEQMWRRVAWGVAQVENTSELRKEWEEKFYGAMEDFRFLPAGRFLTTAGTGLDSTMINCFVIPSPIDSRKGIIKTLEHMTEISARGGGVGFNLSSLRPRGSYVKTVNGTSSGAVSWANLYSVAAHDIIQQGGTRRGALMIMLWDWHPDIEEFISVKKDQNKILGANLSVCVSDKFMEAVKNDDDWDLVFADCEDDNYKSEWRGDIEDWRAKGYGVIVYKTIKARELWDKICESAWASAEPGVVFMDRYNTMNNTWYFEKNIATNPCGEQGLPAWGVCNLSSVNLAAFVDDSGKFDYEELAKVTAIGVRFLDDAVDAEKYLYKSIEKVQKRERRVGLGTTGLADALIKMKVRYGSKESLEIVEKIYKLMRDVAYETSADLANEKGSFAMFNSELYLQSGFMQTMPEAIREKIRNYGVRNALLLTQAPTGKISLLAGVSSGIEPVFSFSYTQKDRLGTRTMYHPLYEKWINENGKENIPDYFTVADDLSPEEHVKIQALIQKYTDSSISKTVNAPNSHSVEDVKNLYTLAFELGCKGVSYMRDGSREGTLIRDEDKKTDEVVSSKVKEEIAEVKQWIRPMVMSGRTYKLKTPVGTAWITVNRDENGSPIELFINIGRAGSDVQAMAEALGRIISKYLKSAVGLSSKERAELVIDQLKGIGGMRPVGFGHSKVMSLPDALAKALAIDMGFIGSGDGDLNGKKDSLINETKVQLTIDGSGVPLEEADVSERSVGDICPECGTASLVHEEGCAKCYSCGFAQC